MNDNPYFYNRIAAFITPITMILSTDPKPFCFKKRQNVLNKGYLQRPETVNGVLKLHRQIFKGWEAE